MGFRALKKKKRQPAIGVWVLLALRPHAVSGAMSHVSIILRDDIQKRMGWEIGTRTEVTLGEGEDQGKLKLSLAGRGYKMAKYGANGIHVNIPAWKALPYEKQDREQCVYEISDGALIVTLPEWS